MKPQIFFNVVLRVPASDLPALTEYVTPYIVKMEPIIQEAAPEPPKPFYVNGKRKKGISADQLVADSLQKKPLTPQELGDIFEGWSFARGSASPAVHRLAQAGKVKFEDGRYHWITQPQLV